MKILFKARGYTQTSLAQAMGVTRQAVVDWIEMATIPVKRKAEIEAILKVKFDEVGSDPVKYVMQPENRISQRAEEAKKYWVTAKPVPFYDVDVAASNIEVFNDKSELPTIAISVPGFEDCDFGVPVFGHSMYPTYDNGCIVMCKKITDLDVIQFGEPHLIITKEQRFVKRILKGTEKNLIICASDNSEAIKDGKRRYDNFEIPKSKIRTLYIIKGSIRRSQL